MPQLIELDGRSYDMDTLSPAAKEAISLVQRAQTQVEEATHTTRLAHFALQGSLANLRAVIATQPVYIPPVPEQPDEPDAGQDTDVLQD